MKQLPEAELCRQRWPRCRRCYNQPATTVMWWVLCQDNSNNGHMVGYVSKQQQQLTYDRFCVKTTATTVTWVAVCQKQQQLQMWRALRQNSNSRIVDPNQPNFLRFRERKLPPGVKDPPSPGEIPLDVHGRQKTP